MLAPILMRETAQTVEDSLAVKLSTSEEHSANSLFHSVFEDSDKPVSPEMASDLAVSKTESLSQTFASGSVETPREMPTEFPAIETYKSTTPPRVWVEKSDDSEAESKSPKDFKPDVGTERAFVPRAVPILGKSYEAPARPETSSVASSSAFQPQHGTQSLEKNQLTTKGFNLASWKSSAKVGPARSEQMSVAMPSRTETRESPSSKKITREFLTETDVSRTLSKNPPASLEKQLSVTESKAKGLAPVPNLNEMPPVGDGQVSKRTENARPQSREISNSFRATVPQTRWVANKGLSVDQIQFAPSSRNENKVEHSDSSPNANVLSEKTPLVGDKDDGRVLVKGIEIISKPVKPARLLPRQQTENKVSTEASDEVGKVSVAKEDLFRTHLDTSSAKVAKRTEMVPQYQTQTDQKTEIFTARVPNVGSNVEQFALSQREAEIHAPQSFDTIVISTDAEVKRAGPSIASVFDTVGAKPEVSKPIVPQLSEAVRTASAGIIEVKLSPEELGRVKLSLSPTEAGLTVTILAERPETMDLIRRNVDLFAQDLRQQGHQSLTFQFGQGDYPAEHSEFETQIENDRIDDEEQPARFLAPQARSGTLQGRLDLRL